LKTYTNKVGTVIVNATRDSKRRFVTKAAVIDTCETWYPPFPFYCLYWSLSIHYLLPEKK